MNKLFEKLSLGVLGGKPIQKITGQLGIGGSNGLSFEDQMKIAALGAAVIGTGGAGAGLLGTGATAAGTTGAATAATTAATTAAATPTVGAQLMGGLKSAGQAAGAAQSVNGLLSPEQLQPAQMMQGNPSGPQTVEQIYQASQQDVQDQINQAMQARMQRRGMWG